MYSYPFGVSVDGLDHGTDHGAARMVHQESNPGPGLRDAVHLNIDFMALWRNAFGNIANGVMPMAKHTLQRGRTPQPWPTSCPVQWTRLLVP